MKLQILVALCSRVVLLTIASLVVGPAVAQSFSCPFGKDAACLDYGDKVCSSRGKCVSSDAVCFDSFTCNFKGFVCKSNFDEVVEKHDEIVDKFNELLRERDDLTERLADTARENSNNIEEKERLWSKLSAAESCVRRASTIEEVQSCSF